jgi:adenosylmethionine-8-amino-7-oxononanoate aminotransferase
MLNADPPIDIVRAEGVWLETRDGRRILDAISSWWVNIHGHNHPRLNRALTQQLERFAHVIFAGFTHEPAERLAKQLLEHLPGELTRVFYSDDGSTAVEVALKMAYQAWRNRGESQRTLFVALEGAYHGDTFGAMAVGGSLGFHGMFSDLLFDVLYLPHPDTGPAYEKLDRIFDEHGERIAAVIIEPMVQGAAGMIFWPAQFLRAVRERSREAGVPLIADEVFTGFGRTGRFLACEHGPIVPDIVCLSKALTGGYLPMGATLCTEEIYEAFLSESRATALLHGHSFTGNALACAVALESLTLFDDEARLERVAHIETLHQTALERVSGLPTVRRVRALGALAAIDLEPSGHGGYFDARAPALYGQFLERNVLLRPLGNTLYILPPYVITDDELALVFRALGDVIAAA